MGASTSLAVDVAANVITGKRKDNPWAVPEKTTYFDLPQSEYDLLPEWNHKELPFELKKYSLEEFMHLTKNVEVGNEERTKLFNHILQEVEEKGFFILTESEEQLKRNREVRAELKKFLDKSLSEKKEFSYEKTIENTIRGGYTQIFFDNRDSVRDPEYRDVYQLYMRDSVPEFPSPTFETLIKENFEYNWEISVAVLALIVTELGYDLSHIGKLFKFEGTEKPEFFDDINTFDDLIKLRHNSENTNLSFFRYYDSQNYKEPQKCMVHQDSGLVTLVPRSSSPGVFIMYDNQWIPIENYTNDNDIVIYFGLSMNWLSLEKVRAVFHRVVRQPHLTRYSWPFELKPNDCALLAPLTQRSDCVVKNPITFDKLTKNIGWLRVMLAVERTDGRNFAEEAPPRDLISPISPLSDDRIILPDDQIFIPSN